MIMQQRLFVYLSLSLSNFHASTFSPFNFLVYIYIYTRNFYLLQISTEDSVFHPLSTKYQNSPSYFPQLSRQPNRDGRSSKEYSISKAFCECVCVMAKNGAKWRVSGSISIILWSFALASMCVWAERSLKMEGSSSYIEIRKSDSDDYFVKFVNFFWQSIRSGYQHIWPEMKFGWRFVVGTIFGFFGAAFGSIGGVGGGGIFVPMLDLIVGFDPKSSTAISKCMIMGAAGSTVYYNLKQRHPTLDIPVIDYDLALLVQPMLMLGISIGVAFNVIFADWMITILLIVLFTATSTKAFFKGVETWKKETIIKKEAAKRLEGNDGEKAEYKLLPGGPSNGDQKETKASAEPEVTLLENVSWKELGLLVFVWLSFLVLQIAKTYTATCSTAYWVLNLLQIPVSVGVSSYEAINLYKGRRIIKSRGNVDTNLQVRQLIVYCSCGVLAGVVGGLLGVGGGSILGPLFLELGIPPQVSSATASFAMIFSSSMSVVEYYLLKRFPVPYALYFILVSIISAYIGQHVISKLIIILGRASLIIFVLAGIIFISAFSLGGVGIVNMIVKIQQNEYMGFENICKFDN
ncbi:sulfite exporter TauE/SafE family protein 3-like [Cornus florida]|uniref:sulfite exporter TauE/SafE family protein 3-like n=1 Tax=Cornus florida TaxID=4283 RepID=UPI0028A1B0A3|nr:sulfite exporter TauE/SafE family protein 3-like [Cornus florida]